MKLLGTPQKEWAENLTKDFKNDLFVSVNVITHEFLKTFKLIRI